MGFLDNARIARKFALVGAVVTLLLATCTLVNFLTMRASNSRLKFFNEKQVAVAVGIAELYAQAVQSELSLRNLVINPRDDTARARLSGALDDVKTDFDRTALAAKGLELGEPLARCWELWDKTLAIKQKVADLAASDQAKAAGMLVQEETPAWRVFKDELLKLHAVAKKELAVNTAGIEARNLSVARTNLILLVAAALLTGALLYAFSRDLSRRLLRVGEGLRGMAEGDCDLTKRIDLDSNDELGQIARLFNRSWDKLDRLIAEIFDHSTQVGTFAGQLSIQSHRIIRNSRQIAGQSESVATAGEEMAATSYEIAKNCSKAAGNSTSANDVAESGQGAVTTTTARMSSIKRELECSSQVIERLGLNSEKIGEIAHTIQDIADQTNLLALNAAIEAARAGEQGRGFAVVADEVRALAERTAKATREIASMIGSIQVETGNAVCAMKRSVDEVSAGVDDARDSGSVLGNIIEQIGEVTMQMSQIAIAAEQQTTTTTEVVGNINGISDSIGDFEHAAVAINDKIDQLMEISDKLKTTSSTFKVDLDPLAVLNVAKQDHILFVNRIARCLDGKEAIQSRNLPDHAGCRFGKWYFSAGQELCNHSPTFKALNEPHEKIHRVAKEAVDLANRGDGDAAEEKLREVEDLSARIVSMLEQVQQECVSTKVSRVAV